MPHIIVNLKIAAIQNEPSSLPHIWLLFEMKSILDKNYKYIFLFDGIYIKNNEMKATKILILHHHALLILEPLPSIKVIEMASKQS